MTYALARFGSLDDPRVANAYAQIESRQRIDGGWHPNEQLLPGAKREADPSCPFGTVNVLRALTADPNLHIGRTTERAVDMLLDCWVRRDEPYRPVGFGMGGTFRKLQFPFVQHQILKTLDALSLVPAALKDPRYSEMRAGLIAKRAADGTWRAEGVSAPYEVFDFGQKSPPPPGSRWWRSAYSPADGLAKGLSGGWRATCWVAPFAPGISPATAGPRLAPWRSGCRSTPTPSSTRPRYRTPGVAVADSDRVDP